MVCHRGANDHAPENTYASAQPCIDRGVDYLEIDINTSRDGVHYVFHGPDLARTTNGIGKIYEWESTDLDALDCGSWFHPDFTGERIPRLEAFLDWLDDRVKLFLDVKWANLPLLVQQLRDRGLNDRCFTWFGRDKLAIAFAELAPDIAIKINVRQPEDVARAVSGYNAKIVEFGLADPVDEILAACREHGVAAMILEQTGREDAFEKVLASGVDMINLDHADQFYAVRERVLASAR